MRSGIYFILNKISLKLYIGSAVYFSRRKSEHFTRLAKNVHHNEHLQRSYNKHGPCAFEFMMIEFVEIVNLFEREEYYIARHRTTEEEFGYNKCAYGRGVSGKHHSEETKRKISESNKGKIVPQERKDRISKSLKGRKISEEALAKQKAKKASDKTKAKMSASQKERIRLNSELVVKAANARWGDKPLLILNKPPLNAKDYEI